MGIMDYQRIEAVVMPLKRLDFWSHSRDTRLQRESE